MEEAKLALADKKENTRFGFVVRRLWQEDSGELDGDWKALLRDRYHQFESSFDWKAPAGTNLDETFLARTLSVWQRRYVTKLNIQHAAEMVLNIGNLGVAP